MLPKLVACSPFEIVSLNPFLCRHQGLILGSIGFLIPLAPHFFTPDKSLYPIMRSFRLYMLLSLRELPPFISPIFLPTPA